MTKRMKNIIFPLCLFVFALSILAAGGAFAAPGEKGVPKASESANATSSLSLSEYLDQVSSRHDGFRAAELASKGAALTSQEASLLLKPQLSGLATNTTGGLNNPLTAENGTQAKNYSLGLSQATGVGINGKLSWNRSELTFPGLPGYNADYTKLEVSASLMRNFAGREIRAQAKAIESGALARAHGQSFASKTTLLEAESAYWRLALARELAGVQKEAVTRAQRLSDWTGRRVRMSLSDRAEGLQSSTNLQARKLELRNAEDEVRAAAQAFNSARGIVSDGVPEKLTEISQALVASMDVPGKTELRQDVKAAQYQAEATAANAEAQRQRNKPQLELFASAPLTEPDSPPAAMSPFVPIESRPATTIGIRLNSPLDFSTMKRAREGHQAEAQAAELTYQRKLFEEKRDWEDLVAKFRQAKERYTLYAELVKTQKEKLEYERSRQQRGRSTLQQVLFFEQDYEQAELGRIRTLTEVLNLNAQMKLYGVSYESR